MKLLSLEPDGNVTLVKDLQPFIYRFYYFIPAEAFAQADARFPR